jgi:hypothetical protein
MNLTPKTFLLLLCAFPILATAEGPVALPPAPEDSAPLDFKVSVDPKVYAPKDFQKASGLKTFALPKDQESQLTSRELREDIFARVSGLSELVRNLDELDRDLLLMRARNRSSQELKSLYPSFPDSVLENLSKEARSRGKKP